MEILLVFLLLCTSGFILFAKAKLNNHGELLEKNSRISVIIPARNEEKNISLILSSLNAQTYAPYEIIVIDDFSSDRTNEIAKQYDVKIIKNSQLPDGWTGKNWAVWNGFLNSSGDILIFLDADVRLAPRALESLLAAREKVDGVISVVPYHHTVRFYERFSLVPYILGVFAFTSPFERRSTKKGLYGSCIAATRDDYQKINGHDSVKSELLDDLNLGKKFSEAGIKVENFIGCDLVSFRMYPNGLRSEIEGFGKGAVLGTSTLKPATVILIALWILGLLSVGIITPFLIALWHPLSVYFIVGYLIYTLQVIYFLKYTGNYGRVMPIMHVLSSIFFIYIMLYSMYYVTFVGSVSWKGRKINVRGRKSL